MDFWKKNFEASEYLMILTDPVSGEIVDVNQRFTEVLGYSKEESVGQTALNVGVYAEVSQRAELFAKLLKDGFLRHFDVLLKGADGVVQYGLLSADYVCVDGRDAILAVVTDITETRKMQMAVKESESLYSAIVNAAPEIVLIHQRGQIVFVNQAGISVSGYKKEDILGQSILSFLTRDSRQVVMEVLRNRDQGQAAPDYVVDFITSDGHVKHMVVKTSDITYRNEAAVVAVLLDVTRQQEYEKELEHARLRAEVANRIKTQFLANMSHELRTPMNGIVGAMELMSLRADSQQAEYIDLARQSADRLLKLLDDLLDVTMLESEKMILAEEVVCMRQLTEQLIASYRQVAEAKGLTLQFFPSETVPDKMRGDARRIAQIFEKILDNAVRFTAQGGVTVQLTMAEGDKHRVKVRVADTGPGIPEGMAEHMMQPFMQGDGALNRRFGGAGIGLAIARQMIRLMNGTLKLESLPGQGCVFEYELELREVDESAPSGYLHEM